MTQQSILVVDDEAPMRMLLSSNLKASGYAVRSAADGTEALQLVEEHPFDLLLLVAAVALSGDGQLVASGSFDGMVRLWDARSGACLRTLRPEHRYERMDITGLTGTTDAQRQALLALGAVDWSAR